MAGVTFLRYVINMGWVKIILFTDVNIKLGLTRGLAAWAVTLISITDHEHAQSIRACYNFICVVFGGFQNSFVI
jgi:hypothetical protein